MLSGWDTSVRELRLEANKTLNLGRRRTGQSGPLGELFDHGVDALNTVLEVILFSAAMNLGQGWKAVLTLFGGTCDSNLICFLSDLCAATFTFYVQTWEEYYTQTLTLGFVSGPVEGILTLCIVYAYTAYQGYGDFWHQSALRRTSGARAWSSVSPGCGAACGREARVENRAILSAVVPHPLRQPVLGSVAHRTGRSCFRR